MKTKIVKAISSQLGDIAKIASENFSGLKDIKKAERWIACNFSAAPRMQYFVAVSNGSVSGFILWVEKGGFRKQSVWELEQIAVGKNFQGQGVGTELIEKSLAEIRKYLEKRGSEMKIVEVTTSTENRAQKLYQRTLGAQVECTVKNFFEGDEVVMVARFK
jgi:ribosomal protein S18 acetylase RimI-like enzyme